jgi:hypothetical protein
MTRPAIIPIRHGRCRGLAVAGFEDFDPSSLPWREVRERAPVLPDGVELAKRSRSRLVLRTRWRGHDLYVKRAIARTWRHRVSVLLQGSKPQREWHCAQAFLARGILVPRPVFYCGSRSGPCYLATEALPAAWRPLADVVAERGIDPALLADVARYTRWLHDLPALHADYRSDHVWLTDAPPDAPLHQRFALMDLDGSRAGRRAVTGAERATAFLQLFISLLRAHLDQSTASAMIDAYTAGGARAIDAAALLDRARREFLASKGR